MIPLQPNDPFDWAEAGGLSVLVCRPFQHLAFHVFTTRHWPLGLVSHGDEGTRWADVARAMHVEPGRLLRVHQVHGADLVVQRAGQPVVKTGDADVLVTDDSSVALAIQTADCVPLLMADARTGAIAAAHAGWRGLALRVPSVAVAALRDELGSRPSDLVAAIGPSIGSCCYEVGVDVRQRFVAAGFSDGELRRWFLAETNSSSANPSLPQLLKSVRKGQWFFDATAATRDQLLAAGLPPNQIFVAELCTASHPKMFCSYRRDGTGAGRMAAAIRKLDFKR
jgi:YfiH family protein